MGVVLVALLAYLGACAPPLAGVGSPTSLRQEQAGATRLPEPESSPVKPSALPTASRLLGDPPELRTITTAPLLPRLRDGADESVEASESPHALARIRVDDVAGGGGVGAALEVAGVSFATPVRTGTLSVSGGAQTLSYLAVEPKGFRVMVPRVTAHDGRIWRELAEGALVVSHRAGGLHALSLGDWLSAPRGLLHLAAFASMGSPLPEAVLTRTRASELGLRGTESLLVAVADDEDARVVADRLAEAGVGRAEVLPTSARHTAGLVGHDRRTITDLGEFTYIDDGDGSITIDPAWVDEHIVETSVPALGEVVCHRALIGPLTAVMTDLGDWNLDHLIDPDEYGGTRSRFGGAAACGRQRVDNVWFT